MVADNRPPPDPAPALRFSTDAYAAGDRVEAWRALFGHTICQTDIEPAPGTEFHSDVVLRALPGLGMASGTCSGARYRRTSRLIVDDDLLFIVNRAGTDQAEMLGRQCEVKAGEAVLLTTGAAGRVFNQAAAGFTTLRLPRAALAERLPDLHGAMVKPVAAADGALRMLLDYIGVLEEPEALRTDEQCRVVVGNVHDLIALALGARADAAQAAKHRGLSAARLRAVKTALREAVARRAAVDVNAVAARHDITPRYLQMLFERDGTTLTEFVTMARLAAAHRMLRDPRQNHLRIVDIALAAGFNDVSYFNRAFRARFGRAPSDVRNAPETG